MAGGDVTITGGAASNATIYDVGSTTDDALFAKAQAYADEINYRTYHGQSVELYSGTLTPAALVISPASQPSTTENLAGFSEIVIIDSPNTQTVFGGGIANQTVLGGTGGLTFRTAAGDTSNIEFAAVGGANSISLVNNSGSIDIFTGSGNDTLLAGAGAENVSLGLGSNSVQGGSGALSVDVNGTDTVSLGTAYNNVYVDPAIAGDSVLVHGATSTSITGFNLDFNGGSGRSTVESGAGAYLIRGGVGGGVFFGATSGANNIHGEIGAVSITGGHDDDDLEGGTGNDTIVAGSGNNVSMVGGGGSDSFVGGSGFDNYNVDGADTISLGTGGSRVYVASGDASILGATAYTGTGYSLDFIGGTGASTVLGGSGSYDINAESGGGVFHGGTDGMNNITGTGAMTIYGAHDGDFLQGGNTGNNLLVAGAQVEILSAGAGNTTLVGNSGKVDFSFANIGSLAAAYTIDGYHTGDVLHFGSGTDATYALNHYDVSSGTNGTITLSNGGSIVLQGYTSPLHVQSYGTTDLG